MCGGATEWSHPYVASQQLPGSGESEPVAALPEIPTSLNLQGAVDKGVPEPWEFHPQRERVRQAGAVRAGGARCRTGEGCEESGDLRALPWLPHGSRRGTPGVFSSSSSPPKQLGEQSLGGKLEQWKQPKIFSTPKPCFSCYHQRLRGGTRGQENWPNGQVPTRTCLLEVPCEDSKAHFPFLFHGVP